QQQRYTIYPYTTLFRSGNRIKIMQQYIEHTFERRKQLNMQSFNVVNNLGVIPSEYDLQIRFYHFRQYLMKLTKGKSKDRKTKNRSEEHTSELQSRFDLV